MLMLIRGLPGSGKTRRAKEFPFFHVEIDMFRYKNGKYIYRSEEDSLIAAQCYNIVKTLVHFGSDVVVANTFTKRQYIEPYRLLAMNTGIDFVVETMTGEYHSRHNVPREIIEKMRNEWQDWPGEIFIEDAGLTGAIQI